MLLFVDTETTGKANLRLPVTHPSQPRIVQIAAVLMTEELDVVHSFSAIIHPVGFVIPGEAANIHGITTERAIAHGIDGRVALSAVRELAYHASMFVGHNADFDYHVLQGEMVRLETDADRFAYSLPVARYCTMKEATGLCKLPGAYGWKWPKLSEAVRILLGEEMTGAHNALTDLRYTVKLYDYLKRMEKENAKTPEAVAVSEDRTETRADSVPSGSTG